MCAARKRADARNAGFTKPARDNEALSDCCCACRRHQNCLYLEERRLRYVAVFWAALGRATAGLCVLRIPL